MTEGRKVYSKGLPLSRPGSGREQDVALEQQNSPKPVGREACCFGVATKPFHLRPAVLCFRGLATVGCLRSARVETLKMYVHFGILTCVAHERV
jgi:hypothetical protein